MESNTLPLGKVFGQDRRLIVPLFQRPYVWNQEEQWEPLWTDIVNVADRWLGGKAKPHFLGAIVLDAQRKPIGHLETRLIIDGQQRLTTMQLLYEAFCDICAELKVDKYHRALVKLTRNDDPMSEDPDEMFKVWPTTVDQPHFRRVMAASSRDEVLRLYVLPSPANAQKHPMASCYLYFYREIYEWLNPSNDEFESRLKVLYDVVREGLRVVAINLDDLDDPQVIFETLNARGTPLLPADLIKNNLFYKASLERQDLGSLYQKYWKPFDQEDTYWRHQIGRGHARRARIDLFFQNYLTAKKKDEVLTGHLYVSFREYVSDSQTALDHLAEIQKYARVYQHFDNWPEGSLEKLFFDRVAAMETASAHPFLLELFARHEDSIDQIHTVLTCIESFLVRRMVCGLSTRAYNRLFVDMLAALDGSGTVSERVSEFLLTSTAASNRWPDDKEFEDAWLSRPVYEILVQRRVQMLLLALNMRMRSHKTEEISYRKLEIEHLLPRSWQKNYPLPQAVDEKIALDRRNSIIHTIGNLTLITSPLNSENSNEPWSIKLNNILTHSALNLNRNLQSFTKDCGDQWCEDSIRQRSRFLFQLAKEIWPWPQVDGTGSLRTGDSLSADLIDYSNVRESRDGSGGAAEDDIVLLEKGSVLWARVNSDEIPPDVAKFRTRKTTSAGNSMFFVAIYLTEDLRLIAKNRKPSSSPCLCFIPALQQQVESLNEAYTKISRTFEPTRRSNANNVFLVVYVEEGSHVVRLDTLRQRKC